MLLPGLAELPPADGSGDNPDREPAAEMGAGLSPRLLWTLFVTWRSRWAFWVGISRPGMDLLAAYVPIYLFQEEPVAILLRLQQLLAMLLPATALGPVGNGLLVNVWVRFVSARPAGC